MTENTLKVDYYLEKMYNCVGILYSFDDFIEKLN